MAVEFIGPFAGDVYKIALDGYRVPNIVATLVPGTDDVWNLLLDERFGIEVKHSECEQWIWIVANAMAIGAGYSCFGRNSAPANPFKCQMLGISFTEEGEK